MDRPPKPPNRLEKSKAPKAPDLRTLEVQIPKIATPEERSINTSQSLEVLFNGMPVRLDISKSSILDGNGRIFTSVSIFASPKLETQTADVVISVWKNLEGTCQAKVNVGNRTEVKGLGLALWELSLPVMQKFAKAYNLPVSHSVMRKLMFGVDGATSETPMIILLEEHGYKRDYKDTWRKTYTP